MNTETDYQQPEPIETQAVVVRDSSAPRAPVVENHSITPAQAKIDAVASVTMAAYSKASQLALSAEEVNALKADFPDEAFKPGAAGKENLIYCEHAFLRDRLDSALGMGQWALVPRNRWAEPFKTNGGKDGSRVYFEGMLMVRGCFVAEAIGEMEYYPHNAAQNYGDAVEGAESACLRRCCKKWGIGLQAWKKDWCDGWWQRKRKGATTSRTPAPTQTQALPSKPIPEAKPEPKKASSSDVLPQPKDATDATRLWFMDQLRSVYSDEDIRKYFEKMAFILPGAEKIDDIPLRFVPTSRAAMAQFTAQMTIWAVGVPPEVSGDDPEYFKTVIHIPRKGMKRVDYMKSPDTIGSLYHALKGGDADAGRRLWGLANMFEVKQTWVDGNHKEHPRKPSEIMEDNDLRAAFDQFIEDHEDEDHEDEDQE